MNLYIINNVKLCERSIMYDFEVLGSYAHTGDDGCLLAVV